MDESAIAEVERRIAAIAACSHTILTVHQLLEAGLHRNGISRRVSARRLFHLHHGVYSIVPPRLLRIEGVWLAAVLACGPGAVLSHVDAAALWDLRGIPSGRTHVSVPTTNGRRRRSGIIVHRTSTLLPSQTTLHRGIPVTKPARTLSDLRRSLPRSGYEAAVHRAEKLQLDTTGAGVAPEEEPDTPEFERRLLALCRRHSLPRPLTQQVIGPYTVDFLWPQVRLIVETDGFEDHGTRSGFEADRARDAWLVARGYRVVRFTWRQLKNDPASVVRVLRELLVDVQ